MLHRMKYGIFALALAWAAPALAQNQDPGGQGGAGGFGGPPNFAEMRQRMEQQLKQELGVDDQQWSVMQPKIEKIQQLQREINGGPMGMPPPGGGPGEMGGAGMGGPGDMGPGRDQNQPGADVARADPGQTPGDQQSADPNAPSQGANRPRDNSPIAQARRGLADVLEDTDAKPDEITAATEQLREARQKAQTQLAQAQDDLKHGLTPRQEAVLVSINVIP